MKKSYYIFISQLLAALTSQKPFFIVKKTKASAAIANVFMELNIIKFASIPDKYMLRRMQKTYQERYIAYWLHNINTLKNKNKVKVQDPALIKSVKSIQVYHKIELIGKKSNYHQNKISYTTLKDIRPIQNTIYIMQTSKGLITSIEAIKHKVGGFIICKISL